MDDPDRQLASLLAKAGSSLRTQWVRETLAQTKRELAEDNLAHGGPEHEPFWDMVSDEGIHVFAVFSDAALEIYVLKSDFRTLVTQLDAIAAGEPDVLKSLLREQYGVEAAGMTLSRPLAEYWLS